MPVTYLCRCAMCGQRISGPQSRHLTDAYRFGRFQRPLLCRCYAAVRLTCGLSASFTSSAACPAVRTIMSAFTEMGR